MAPIKKPDFICVGAQKSGTTWLYHELNKHPNVRMPAVKELRYFFDHKMTLEQYWAHFADSHGFTSGDITPAYLISETAAREIKQVLPQARVFAILRDPTERAFSQWRMMRRRGVVDPQTPFREVFHRDIQFVRSRGHYAQQLENYLRFFQLGQDFQVYLYDELRWDPAGFIRRIERFVGVAEHVSPTVGDRHLSLHHGDGLAIAPGDEQQLRHYYASHNERLAELLGVALTWTGYQRGAAAA